MVKTVVSMEQSVRIVQIVVAEYVGVTEELLAVPLLNVLDQETSAVNLLNAVVDYVKITQEHLAVPISTVM
jgi:hypothetical protein